MEGEARGAVSKAKLLEKIPERNSDKASTQHVEAKDSRKGGGRASVQRENIVCGCML